jgi:Tfp pilus assembly protein PilV
MNKRNKHSGFLLTELIVALTVLVIILSCLAMALKIFRNINQYQLTRQRCISAAHAQLDCITVTGKEISDEDFKRLWPKMSVEIKQSDGIDQWQGLKLVKVKAAAQADNKVVSVEMARYFAPKGESGR